MELKVGDIVKCNINDYIFEVTELPDPSAKGGWENYYRGLDHSDGAYGRFRACDVNLIERPKSK